MQINSQYIGYVSTFSGNRTDNRKYQIEERINSKTETFANKLYEKANANGGSYGELEKCFSEDITDSAMVKASGKPAHHWYDGQYGYSADVYSSRDSDSEYTVRLRYDDGRIEERIVDADSVDGSNCNFIDLSVKLYHLQDEGKLEKNDVTMNLVSAHFKVSNATPEAGVHTNLDFRSWYEQQLKLDMGNTMSPRGVERLLGVLKWL